MHCWTLTHILKVLLAPVSGALSTQHLMWTQGWHDTCILHFKAKALKCCRWYNVHDAPQYKTKGQMGTEGTFRWFRWSLSLFCSRTKNITSGTRSQTVLWFIKFKHIHHLGPMDVLKKCQSALSITLHIVLCTKFSVSLMLEERPQDDQNQWRSLSKDWLSEIHHDPEICSTCRNSAFLDLVIAIDLYIS